MRISSSLGREELLETASHFDILLLNPATLRSVESVEIALELTRRSFANGTNISNQKRFEFLLWLSGKKDISSAIRETSFRSSSDILLFAFSGETKKTLRALHAKKIPVSGIAKKASPEEIERMSISRI